jgi:hypothetical protein
LPDRSIERQEYDKVNKSYNNIKMSRIVPPKKNAMISRKYDSVNSS